MCKPDVLLLLLNTALLSMPIYPIRVYLNATNNFSGWTREAD